MQPKLRQLKDQIDVTDQANDESQFDYPPTNPMHPFPKQGPNKDDKENQHTARSPISAPVFSTPQKRNRVDEIGVGLHWVVEAPSDDQDGQTEEPDHQPDSVPDEVQDPRQRRKCGF